jgi:hypothetical protein
MLFALSIGGGTRVPDRSPFFAGSGRDWLTYSSPYRKHSTMWSFTIPTACMKA